MSRTRHLVVIGGGAAGFFCAVNAARLDPQLRVTIVEKASRVLHKVQVSGGGRCNVTHHCFSIPDMARRYPRGEQFVKRAFRHFFVPDTIEWFASRGVALKHEADGRMFPVTDSSQTIIDCLLQEANRYGVEVLMNFSVAELTKQAPGWHLQAADGRQLQADLLCVACGGFPKAEQFDWLVKATGHSIVAPVPSLFTFNLPGHPITQLMGVATPVRIRLAGTKWEAEGPCLITHWGLSGPAVLRLSAFGARHLAEAGYRYSVLINWLPNENETGLREQFVRHRHLKATQKIGNTDGIALPQRLWHFLLLAAGLQPDMRWADVPAAGQNKLAKCLCSYEVEAAGKTTFKDEFVTAGGVDTAEVDVAGMQSRLHLNLFFAGEILNVDGITGGFNFQHAWNSGFVAASAIANARS